MQQPRKPCSISHLSMTNERRQSNPFCFKMVSNKVSETFYLAWVEECPVMRV
jgi:hypothetical protein